jgi:hypothetical protein
MSPLIFSHNSPRMVKNSRQFISGNILESTQKSTLILMSFFFFLLLSTIGSHFGVAAKELDANDADSCSVWSKKKMIYSFSNRNFLKPQFPNNSFSWIWFKIVLFIYEIATPNPPLAKLKKQWYNFFLNYGWLRCAYIFHFHLIIILRVDLIRVLIIWFLLWRNTIFFFSCSISFNFFFQIYHWIYMTHM